MRRKVPDDVPARCPPSELWACAVTGAAAISAASASGARARSEVDIELKPPRGARTVVGRVVHLGNPGVVVDVRHVRGVVLALAPHVALARDLVDTVDEPVV